MKKLLPIAVAVATEVVATGCASSARYPFVGTWYLDSERTAASLAQRQASLGGETDDLELRRSRGLPTYSLPERYQGIEVTFSDSSVTVGGGGPPTHSGSWFGPFSIPRAYAVEEERDGVFRLRIGGILEADGTEGPLLGSASAQEVRVVDGYLYMRALADGDLWTEWVFGPERE